MALNPSSPIPVDFQDIFKLIEGMFPASSGSFEMVRLPSINYDLLSQKSFTFAFEALQQKIQDVVNIAVNLGIEQQKLNELNDFYNSQRKVLQNV